MGQRPVASPSFHGQDDRADGRLDGLPLRDELPDVQLHGKPEGLRTRPHAEGKGRKRRLLPHSLPVRRETVNIPVPGRGKVEFPVPPGIPHPQKELQARLFPEPVLPSRGLHRRGDGEIRQVPQECATDRQCVRTSPDRPLDPDTGEIFRDTERLQGKAPEIHSYRRCPERRFLKIRSSRSHSAARSRHPRPCSSASRSRAEPHRRSNAGTCSTNS